MPAPTTNSSSPFAFKYQSPPRINDASPTPLFFNYESPQYKEFSPVTIPFMGSSSPLSSPVASAVARRGPFPTKETLKRRATDWAEDFVPNKRRQVSQSRTESIREEAEEELEGYSEEPFAGNLQEPQAADEHAQEDVVEVEQHAEVDAPRFDLLGNIDALVQTICNLRSEIEDLQNERDEHVRALQEAHEELEGHKQTVARVLAALGYEAAV